MICPCAELPWVATRGQLLAFLILNYEKVNGHSWVETEGNSALGQIIVKIYYLIRSHEKAFAIQTADWLRNWARSDPHEFHVRCLIEPKMCFPRLSIPKKIFKYEFQKHLISFVINMLTSWFTQFRISNPEFLNPSGCVFKYLKKDELTKMYVKKLVKFRIRKTYMYIE